MPRWKAKPGHAALLDTGLVVALLSLAAAGGCPWLSSDTGETLPVFNNTTDPSNGGATYVGSAACGACHAEIATLAASHGHTQALKPVAGAAPTYANAGDRAGVPNPPTGKTWSNVSYLIGGYTHGAVFVDTDGYVMTDGVEGVNTRWNLTFAATGTAAGFGAYLPLQATPLAFEHECFRCHTTGPNEQTAATPQSQDGRPGILGTWHEAGVQCEACHGPGGNHVPQPSARDLYTDSSTSACRACHSADPDKPTSILVEDGYLNPNAQWSELRASGGHGGFGCTVCHDPHASTSYDRSNGIRNACTSCHADATMAGHANTVFVRGDYSEAITCESCHMPFAGRSNSVASAALVGSTGKMGDVRTHIFRIDTTNLAIDDILSPGGTQLILDANGRAALTVDFVCLRCHTDDTATPNSAFPLSAESALEITTGLHRLPE